MNQEALDLQTEITKKLADNGDLAKIKAELRAKIGMVMKDKQPSASPPDFLSSDIAKTAIAVVYEFLQHYDLKYTEMVLQSETNTTPQQVQDVLEDSSVPMLMRLLKNHAMEQPLESELQTNDATE